MNQVYTAEPSGHEQSTPNPLANHPLPAWLTINSMDGDVARRPMIGTLYGEVLLRNWDTRVARLKADALTSPVAISSPWPALLKAGIAWTFISSSHSYEGVHVISNLL